MTNIEEGIRLRSGKIVFSRDGDHIGDDDRIGDDAYIGDGVGFCDYDYDYEYDDDGKIKPLLTGVPLLPQRFRDSVEESIENEDIESVGGELVMTSFDTPNGPITKAKIDVPNGFEQIAGDYLEQLNGYYQDCKIDLNQLHELVRGFGKYLNWFPDDVPQRKIKKFCREAYSHILWKSFVDEEITRRQFMNLMGKKPKFFRKK